MQFQIVKGEPEREHSQWYNRIVTYTPVFWVDADGMKHFITNLPSDTGSDFDEKNEQKELDRKVAILNGNGGRFFPVYLKNWYTHFPIEDVEAFLAWKRENGYTFDKVMTDPIVWDDNMKCFEFHGNLGEYSAAFWFRIYDKELAGKCIAALAEDGITDNQEMQ